MEVAMIPRVSHPAVHPDPAPAPVEAPAAPAPAPAPAQGQGENAPPGVVMGRPHPGARIGVRLAQALLAAAALAATASAREFASVTAFRYLVAATGLQCLWSLAVAILRFYGLLVGRTFVRPFPIICIGDWITGSLTFNAACASAGITTFISADLEACYENHCPSFMAATAMAFLSWFAVAPGCFLNLIMMVRKLQRQ